MSEESEDQTWAEMSAWAHRDLLDDVITTDQFPGPGDPEVLAWISELGLDPFNIPKDDIVIDPQKMRLYWREFWLNEEGQRMTSATGAQSFRRTPTKSMPLESLPAFLNRK